MKKLLSLALGLISLSWNALAAAPTAAETKQIEDYLNNIKTLSATFVQTASNGGSAEGKIYIAKPNKIRMEYNDPTSVLIVGDGSFIVYNDKELDQVTHIDYDDIPATLILANDLKIDGKNLKISDFYSDSGIMVATLEYPKKPDISPITLTFEKDPFELKQWKIVDPQSVEVTVSIYNTLKDQSLNGDLFKFKKDKKSPLNYKNKK